MSKFKFDPKDSPDENIGEFFEHLKSHDNEMAEILLKNLSRIDPLPDAPAQRTAARKNFNNQVIIVLRQLQVVKTEKSENQK